MAAKRVTVPPTQGDINIAWIEQYLRVPEGRDVGKPIILRPFQREIIKGVYDSPTRRAIISMGRKNAKTTLSAMLLLLHLCGPMARANSQLFSAAQSRDQASILFALAAKMIRQNADLVRYLQIRETAKQLLCPELGTSYRALSADAALQMGLSPAFLVHDETGQVKGPRSELFDALETACAAHESPLSVVISTQAPTDADLLSILIDDARSGADPMVKLFFWTAPDDLDPFGDDAILAANPAAGDFSNMDELRRLAQDAKRMPSREAEYRVLVLNQRTEAVNPFVSKQVWDLNNGTVVESLKGYPVYASLDLSETADLTAACFIAQIDGQWHVQNRFWLPQEGLAEKSRKDRVPYDQWHREGFLEATPGRAVEYRYVAKLLYAMSRSLDIRAVAFDRYNFRHLKPWLVEAGFNENELTKFVEFGQGFVSMSPALRSLEVALLNGKINHGGHPVLSMCAANATTESDGTGNRKLSKRRSRGRIDGLVCLAMALSVATTTLPEVVMTSIYDREDLKEFL